MYHRLFAELSLLGMKATATHQVDDYIGTLPEPQQSVAGKLREILFETVPGIEEKFSFKLPFYHWYGMFCYLRAADGVVYLCFCRGKDLRDAFPRLEQRERATICCVAVTEMKDVHRLELPQLIATAAEWNKEAKLKKIPMVQKKGTTPRATGGLRR